MSDDAIKTALKLMPYGFYAITSKTASDENAMVANWVTQASFSPRLLALGIQNDCHSYGLIKEGQVFTVNIFQEADQEAMMPFTKSRAKKPDKMIEATYTAAPETGCPVLEGATAYIECRVQQIVETGGDHDIVIGECVNAGILKENSTVEDTLSLVKIGWSYAG